MQGTLENFNFEGVCLWTKDLTSAEVFEEQISNDFGIFKLHFTIKGSYYFSLVNDKTGKEVSQGYCNLFRIEKIDGIQKLTGERISTVEVFFTRKYLKDLLGESYEQALITLGDFPSPKNAYCLWEISKITPPSLTLLVMGILQCAHTGRAKESFMKAKIDCILLDFFLGNHPCLASNPQSLSESDYKSMLKVEAYIKQNLKKQLTIDHLSSLAGLNTTKLKRDFKKVFSTTIFKHITQLRMQKAKQLILDNDYSVAQASFHVGYSNPQHFTVAFKKTMGYLPSKLKESEV